MYVYIYIYIYIYVYEEHVQWVRKRLPDAFCYHEAPIAVS